MSKEFKMVPVELLEYLLNDPALVVRMSSDSIIAIKAAIAAPVPPAGDVEVYAWVWTEEMNGEEVNDGISFGPDKPDFAARSTLSTTFNYAPVYTQHVVTRLTAENARLRDALDHIAKTCGQSRTDTRRIRWIEARANTALEGKDYDARLIDFPVNGDNKSMQQRRKIDELQAHLTKARETRDELFEVSKYWKGKVEKLIGLLTDLCDTAYIESSEGADAHSAAREFLAHQSAPAANFIACNVDESCGQSAPACCVPSAEDLALIQAGDFRAEELWGGPRPTCPKCINQSAPAAKGGE